MGELALSVGPPTAAARTSAPSQPAWVVPPRLPVPDLAASCRGYQALAEALLEPPALAATRAAIDDFLAGAGRVLQDRLIDWDAASDTSYVHEFWRDLYLANRSPLPIEQNVAGGVAVPAHWRVAPLASRAALVALATADFLRAAGSGRLDQDLEHGRPLCMAQYPSLPGAVRIPGRTIDRLRTGEAASHCIVAWRGGFYPLSLPDDAGADASRRLAGQMAAILGSSARPPAVGLLTAARRPEWAALRDRLLAASPASLTAIETASFVLCLGGTPARGVGPVAGWLGGDADRWFDKSLQVIVDDGPTLGCNIEHSGIDGFTVARYGHHVLRFLERCPPPIADTGMPAPEPLGWEADDGLTDAIATVAREVARDNGRLRLRCFEVAGCPGGVRGDLVVQLAIQLAYFEFAGALDSVYQPVHMRRYRAGRTEAVRPVTRDTLAFCRLAAGGAGDAAIAPMARRALCDIKARASRSRKGGGFDRHLFALYNLAARHALPAPLFEDPAYWRLLGPAILCTSSVDANSGLDRFAFGPVRPDGFGIAYVADRGGARLCLTGWRDDLDAFCGRLEAAIARVARLSGGPGYLNE